MDVLHEYPITFAPSYPYEEEPSQPQHYMKTRCPAWCDRILLSTDARSLVVAPPPPRARTSGDDSDGDRIAAPEYDVIGDAVCMGDHKVCVCVCIGGGQAPIVTHSSHLRIVSQPIYLGVRLATQKGTIRCCRCSDLPLSHQANITLPITHHNRFATHASATTPPPPHETPHTHHNAHTHTPQQQCTPTGRCLYTSSDVCAILAECVRFNRRHSHCSASSSRSSDSLMAAPTTATAKDDVTVRSNGNGPLGGHTLSLVRCAADSVTTEARARTVTDARPTTGVGIVQPVINVIDADNEPICMCSLYASSDNVRELPETLLPATAATTATTTANDKAPPAGEAPVRMCTVCRNAVRRQPIESRRTLVSKRLQLTCDIVVNRVDTHYLHLAASSSSGSSRGSGKRLLHDPYTPDSVESRSPSRGDGLSEAELDDEPDEPKTSTEDVLVVSNGMAARVASSTDDRPECGNNNRKSLPLMSTSTAGSGSGRGVSPRALKSRLEDLQATPPMERATGNSLAISGEDVDGGGDADDGLTDGGNVAADVGRRRGDADELKEAKSAVAAGRLCCSGRCLGGRECRLQ